MWLDMHPGDVVWNMIFLCGENKIGKFFQSGSGSEICRITFHSFSLFSDTQISIWPQLFIIMEPEEPEKQTMLDSETMLLSPIHAAAPRPRTVTCISAPDDSSPGSPRERDAFSVSRPRSKSVRMKNQVRGRWWGDQESDTSFQAGIVRHGRSNSIVSKSGRRIYKNLGRMHSVDHDVSFDDKYSKSIFHLPPWWPVTRLIVSITHFYSQRTSRRLWDSSDWTASSRTRAGRRMPRPSLRGSSGMTPWSSWCPASPCQLVRW